MVDSDKKESAVTTIGRKFDSGKPDYDLLPSFSLEEVVKVLTVGKEKYEKNNWVFVNDAQSRYFSAAMRHLWAWRRGELNDPESNLNHLSHSICCILFLLEMQLLSEEELHKQYGKKSQ